MCFRNCWEVSPVAACIGAPCIFIMAAQSYWRPYPDPIYSYSTHHSFGLYRPIHRSNLPSRLKYGDQLYWTFICKCHITKLLNSFCWLSSINNLTGSEPKHQKESCFSFLLSSLFLTSILLSLFWKEKELFLEHLAISLYVFHIFPKILEEIGDFWEYFAVYESPLL
jgi:hypothetical protein